MPKHLIIDGDAADKWTLPDDADIDQLEEALANAMVRGTVHRVPVVLSHGSVGNLVVSGKSVRTAVAYDEPPATVASF